MKLLCLSIDFFFLQSVDFFTQVNGGIINDINKSCNKYFANATLQMINTKDFKIELSESYRSNLTNKVDISFFKNDFLRKISRFSLEKRNHMVDKRGLY